MNIEIISGSTRKNSQSRKVADYLQSRLETLGFVVAKGIIDLHEEALPFWDEEGAHKTRTWEKVMSRLKAAEALVIVVPEWDGMAPAALKNFFHLIGEGEVANKPALLVGISAGPNGAYPIAELRSSSYKNNRLCYIPEQIIIRNVKGVLNEVPAKDAEYERTVKERIDYALRVLYHYGKALGAVRESAPVEWGRFRFGQ